MKPAPLRHALLRVALLVALLLLVPAIAMRFSDEVNWGVLDFLAAGLLLFGAGAAIVLAVRRFQRPLHKALAVATVALAVAAAWAELAVGLFD